MTAGTGLSQTLGRKPAYPSWPAQRHCPPGSPAKPQAPREPEPGLSDPRGQAVTIVIFQQDSGLHGHRCTASWNRMPGPHTDSRSMGPGWGQGSAPLTSSQAVQMPPVRAETMLSDLTHPPPRSGRVHTMDRCIRPHAPLILPLLSPKLIPLFSPPEPPHPRSFACRCGARRTQTHVGFQLILPPASPKGLPPRPGDPAPSTRSGPPSRHSPGRFRLPR